MTAWTTETLESCLEALLDYRGKSPTKSESGIPVLSAKVVKTAGLLRPIEQTIAPDYYPKWMTRGFPMPGDVVMTTEAPLGEVIQLDEETASFALGQRLVCLRGKAGKLDNTFLRYLLASPGQQEVLANRATGTTVLGVSQKTLRSMPIAFPEFSEQQRIGDLLATLDDKIELNRRMNETLEAMARALFRDWFVDFGPTRAKMAQSAAGAKDQNELAAPYLSPDLWSLFPDRLDEAGKPEEWSSTRLLDLARLISGGTPKTDNLKYWDGGIAWASAKDVSQCSDAFLLRTQRNISKEGLTNSSTKMIPKYSTAIVARGATTGRSCLFGAEIAMNQTCYALASRNDQPFWLNCAFGEFVERLVNAAHGSVFDTITTRTIEGISLIDGSGPLRAAFEKNATPLFERILSNVLETRTLAQTRDLLLPRLMSGELRVTEAARAVEAVL
ncbi:restriction endonuclease subunit S [Antarctobacter heliothermus]|uniref:Type I restriction enzyme, S subunit n=1 Tax=Antarctobacter heliothermus TaxID=74033 RepID=A0A239HSP9_9RHOB|nr:restriction endonuclease subunit S [Antarctobacter heliothermus]SNS83883.1 type I restriction enzyme, S subunit [Antarctobacter heliothermus]